MLIKSKKDENISDINDRPYILATVTKIKQSTKEIEVLTAESKAHLVVKYENTLPYQLIPLSLLKAINDISHSQNDLTINDILTILTERFNSNIFFTLIDNNILLFLNPYFEKTNNIFSDSLLLSQCSDAHLYTLINKIHMSKGNQIMIIRGDNESGKTLLFDNALLALCKLSKKERDSKGVIKITHKDFEEKILNANRIAKLFGSISDDQSKNISKYILRYDLGVNDKRNIILGEVKYYIYDRMIPISRKDNESNFHIFYFFLNSSDINILNNLYLDNDITKYKYLNCSCDIQVERKDNESLSSLLGSLGFASDEIDIIYKFIASILHLGNIEFQNNEQSVVISNTDELNIISEMLQIKSDVLKEALLYNKKTINGTNVSNAYSVDEATAARNAFTIELYYKLLDYVIAKINLYLFDSEKMQKCKKITLIDSTSFDYTGENSLSALCSNYINEKLHLFYLNMNYKRRINLLSSEGVYDPNSNVMKYQDNSSLLDILENEESNLFNSLSDACENNVSSNDLFIELTSKYNMNDNIYFPSLMSGSGKLPLMKKSSSNILKKLQHSSKVLNTKSIFGLYHSNGAHIEYDIDQMIKNNYNDVGFGVYECLLSSSMPEVVMITLGSISSNDLLIKKEQIFDEFIMANGNARRSMFISSIFIEKIGKILDLNVFEEDKKSKVYFALCLRSNSLKREMTIHPRFIWSQLNSYEILNKVNISKTSFRVTLSYKSFCKEFERMIKGEKECDNKTEKEQAIIVIEKLSKKKIDEQKDKCLLGKERIFLQISFYDTLVKDQNEFFVSEKQSMEAITNFIVGYYSRLKFKQMKNGIVKIQRTFRKKRKLMAERAYLNKVIKIQATYRASQYYSQFKKMKYALCKIQISYKKHYQMKRIKKIRQSIKYLVPRLIKFVYRTRVNEKKGIKGCVYKIITKAYDKILYQKKCQAMTKLNSFFRMIIFKNHNPTLIKKIKTIIIKRLITKSTIKIQAFYKGQKVFMHYHIMRFCIDYIRSYWKMKKMYNYIINLRKSTIRIQKYIKMFINKKKAFEAGTKMYIEQNYGKSFSEEINHIKHYLSKSIASFTQSGSRSKIGYDNKIKLMSKILDIDLYNTTKIIYNGEYWIDKYSTLEDYCNKSNTSIISIQTSETHTVLLNSRGKVFSFGWNDNGQCLNSDVNNSNTINQIIINDKYSFFRTSKNTIISNKASVLSNKTIKHIAKNVSMNLNECCGLLCTKEKECYYTIKNKENILQLSKNPIFNVKIEKISCGKNFSMLISTSGILYSLGNKNNKGELGQGDYLPRKELTIVKIFIENGEKIISVRCGFKHTICIGNSGKAYGWGSNTNGQLSLDKYGNFPTPMWIKLEDFIEQKKFMKVISIACGLRSSYFLTENRNVFFSGVSGIMNGQSSAVKAITSIKESTIIQMINKRNIFPVKINCSCNGSFSVFYCTYADFTNIKDSRMTPQKFKWVLQNITYKWDDDNSREPQNTKGLSEYI